ncbi:MAG: HEAT repeat domain-containing protein [Candidatus Latescibacterota bacterium]
MVERFNIPSVTAPGKVWAGLVLLVVGGCTSVSQMQERYEAGDDTQLAKIATIAAPPDYPYATRRSAARVLGEIGDPRIVPVLVSILGEFDQRTTLKEEALIALGRIGDPHAVTAIGRLLDRNLSDTSEELRMAAIPVLGQLGGSEAATILVNALTYYDLIMLHKENRIPRGVFSGDEQSIRDLQDSLRAPSNRQGDLTGYGSGGAFGTPSSMFGGNLALPEQHKVDTTPQERALAHASLARVGAPAVPVIQEHLALQETTVSLRNEFHEILRQIRGEPPAATTPADPG